MIYGQHHKLAFVQGEVHYRDAIKLIYIHCLR